MLLFHFFSLCYLWGTSFSMIPSPTVLTHEIEVLPQPSSFFCLPSFLFSARPSLGWLLNCAMLHWEGQLCVCTPASGFSWRSHKPETFLFWVKPRCLLFLNYNYLKLSLSACRVTRVSIVFSSNKINYRNKY